MKTPRNVRARAIVQASLATGCDAPPRWQTAAPLAVLPGAEALQMASASLAELQKRPRHWAGEQERPAPLQAAASGTAEAATVSGVQRVSAALVFEGSQRFA